MRYIGRIDSNQKEIVKAIRQVGCSVAITSMIGKGFPDIIIGTKNKNLLIEIKDGKKYLSQQKLTSAELNFHKTWQGQIATISTIEEAIELINSLKD